MSTQTPERVDISQFERLVSWDDDDRIYEAINAFGKVCSVAVGDIVKGVRFEFDAFSCVVQVKQMSDHHIYDLSMPVNMIPGDSLVVTYESLR